MLIVYIFLILLTIKLIALCCVYSAAVGQHDCNFNVDMCGYVQPTAVDALRWKHVGSNIGRVPPTDTIGNGKFAFVNADDVVRAVM